MKDDVTVWVTTDWNEKTRSYVVTMSAGDDQARVLTPTVALRYAYGVRMAAAYAAYEEAIFRQLSKKLKLEDAAIGALIADMRKDRPPLDPDLTRPLSFEPGVALSNRKAFLVVLINGKRVGQWTVKDAEGHADHVLDAVAVADLDTLYYRSLTGLVGIESPRAQNVVMDLANWR